jgi:hypothetical protein
MKLGWLRLNGFIEKHESLFILMSLIMKSFSLWSISITASNPAEETT